MSTQERSERERLEQERIRNQYELEKLKAQEEKEKMKEKRKPSVASNIAKGTADVVRKLIMEK